MIEITVDEFLKNYKDQSTHDGAIITDNDDKIVFDQKYSELGIPTNDEFQIKAFTILKIEERLQIKLKGKLIFRIQLKCKDGSNDIYTVDADDDAEAVGKAYEKSKKEKNGCLYSIISKQFRILA